MSSVNRIVAIFSMLIVLGNAGRDKPVFSDDVKEVIEHVHNKCVGKTGVAEEDITNCEKGIFKDDHRLKCYMFCLFDEASLVDKNGCVDFDLMVKMMPDVYSARFERGVNICKKEETMDKEACQRAFDMHSCMYKSDPEFYFLL